MSQSWKASNLRFRQTGQTWNDLISRQPQIAGHKSPTTNRQPSTSRVPTSSHLMHQIKIPSCQSALVGTTLSSRYGYGFRVLIPLPVYLTTPRGPAELSLPKHIRIVFPRGTNLLASAKPQSLSTKQSNKVFFRLHGLSSVVSKMVSQPG